MDNETNRNETILFVWFRFESMELESLLNFVLKRFLQNETLAAGEFLFRRPGREQYGRTSGRIDQRCTRALDAA